MEGLIAALPLKDPARICDEHRLQLLVGHALMLQRGDHVIMDVQVIPSRQHHGQGTLWQPVMELPAHP